MAPSVIDLSPVARQVHDPTNWGGGRYATAGGIALQGWPESEGLEAPNKPVRTLALTKIRPASTRAAPSA